MASKPMIIAKRYRHVETNEWKLRMLGIENATTFTGDDDARHPEHRSFAVGENFSANSLSCSRFYRIVPPMRQVAGGKVDCGNPIRDVNLGESLVRR